MAGEALFPVALSEAKYPVDVEESLRLLKAAKTNKNARSQSAVQKVTQTPEFLRFRPLRAKFFRNLSIE